MRKSILLLSLLGALLYTCAPEPVNLYEAKVLAVDPAEAATRATAIRAEANLTVAPGFDLRLWASDALINDPIAISVAPDGRIFYTQATRQGNSEFDIRGHMDWTEASMSFQTPEDRRAFLRATFTPDSDQSAAHLEDLNEDGVKDWRDLAVEKENIWVVSDESGDGVADRTQRFLEDFGDEITDVANGLTYHDGAVYVGVAPDLWKVTDANNDGIADATESLSHGYGVHVGFSGHGMSGVTVGPQGRLWWGIGDIGSNVVDKTGKRWENPNRGVVVRCDPDGSNFEVFAHGVRNTHEFAFDDYGNLISVDNDGDHAGERERLVYLIDGSDTGWRINWQFGKYTDPKNNDYKVWMDEEMYKTRYATPGSEQASTEQAAYFLPPIAQFVNGPTGLVYNPGTALAPRWYGHFFVSEFRGTPVRSHLHAFSLRPDGAGFALGRSQKIVSGFLPTGIDFGPDGALYVGDWINGWGLKDEGRIWKLDMGAPIAIGAGAEEELRSEVKQLLTQDFSAHEASDLSPLLGHQDQRVRRKAQFELAKRADDGYAALKATAASTEANQLARIHALWGMAQMMRRGADGGNDFAIFLLDADAEIIAQTAKMVGDLRQTGHAETLIGLLGHPSARVRFFAMEALGRTAEPAAIAPIIAMLREDGGRDTWLRHGGMIALGRIGDAVAMRELSADPDRNIRLTAVVALRRMASPLVKAFLDDADEQVVAEAARAITDDGQIMGAMSPLAQRLNQRAWVNEALIRRIIVANQTVGNNRTVDNLITYANSSDNPATMRAEALATLANWGSPSVFDRVDGRYRGQRNKDATYAGRQLEALLPDLLTKGELPVRHAAIAAAAGLKMKQLAPQLTALVTTEPQAALRAAAVSALHQLEVPGLEAILRSALTDRAEAVRARALELLPSSTIAPAAAAQLYRTIVASGTTAEVQAALVGLADLPGPEADALLVELLAELKAGRVAPAAQLELVEAIEARTTNATLQQALADYDDELRQSEDDLGLAIVALAGGDRRQGRREFNNNTAGQCTRCHAVFEHGGNVGPNLAEVGSRLTPKEILTSIVRPSAALAEGHESVLVTLNNGEALSGLVLSRTTELLTLKTGEEESREIPYADIAEEETLPSSMPSAEGKLSRREIRDLVAYLSYLKGEGI